MLLNTKNVGNAGLHLVKTPRNEIESKLRLFSSTAPSLLALHRFSQKLLPKSKEMMIQIEHRKAIVFGLGQIFKNSSEFNKKYQLYSYSLLVHAQNIKTLAKQKTPLIVLNKYMENLDHSFQSYAYELIDSPAWSSLSPEKKEKIFNQSNYLYTLIDRIKATVKVKINSQKAPVMFMTKTLVPGRFGR